MDHFERAWLIFSSPYIASIFCTMYWTFIIFAETRPCVIRLAIADDEKGNFPRCGKRDQAPIQDLSYTRSDSNCYLRDSLQDEFDKNHQRTLFLQDCAIFNNTPNSQSIQGLIFVATVVVHPELPSYISSMNGNWSSVGCLSPLPL